MQAFKAWRNTKHHQRAERALARQLEYQKHKSELMQGAEEDFMKRMMVSSLRVRNKHSGFRTIGSDVRVAEIGSGAHGLIRRHLADFGRQIFLKNALYSVIAERE